MNAPAGIRSVAERLVDATASLSSGGIPAQVRQRCEDLLVDVGGLCVAARASDYVRALVASVDGGGPCTAIGHAGSFRAEDAAMISGTAAHGERFERGGQAALRGIASGVETMCRLSLVAPKLIHKAGFHPTSVLGAMAATLGVSAALGLDRKQTVDALGIAGSMAGGIIEYLAEGAWTKRLHAGWAARVGLHAARIGREGFLGPRTVFEGTHGFFFAFAHDGEGDFEALTRDFGRQWLMEGLTFKPYATGTMNQPYIDCALRLAKKGFAAEDVAEVLCETAEGYVHRLWEPLASKHRPPNEYAAKFSTPFNIAVAFVTGGAGFEAFTEKTVRDPRILALASKVRYVVDPNNPYPKAYTGHVKMTLRDGRVLEERQPHIRGGVHEPLTREEIERKFRSNATYGGWDTARADGFLQFARNVFDKPVDLSGFRG